MAPDQRASQCHLYQCLIALSECTNRQELIKFVDGLDVKQINDPISIDVAPNCSCGRFFEQHPTIIEDTEEERMEIFEQQLLRGYCKCLAANYKESGCQWTTARRNWIHVLAALGNLELMQAIVKKGKCDINAATSLSHFTALSLAVMKTKGDIVSWLCALPGIDPNVKSKNEKHTPLIDAMLAEKYHIVDILVSSPAVDLNAKNFRDETPLVVAIRMNNARLVRSLLQAGADHTICTANRVSPLMLAVGSSYLVIREFVEAKVPLDNLNEYGESALTLAIRNRALDTVDTLIRGGASCQSNPALPAIVLAASLGHLGTFFYLLDISQNPDQTDDLGWTALHYACTRGFPAMVELLLDRDVNVNLKTSCDNTALSLAVFHRYTSIAQLLINYGCEVNTSNEDLDTPLHYAAFNADRDVVRSLLDMGAEACSYNCAGSTPLFNAVVSDNMDIVKMLLPHYVDADVETPSLGFTYTSWYTKTDFYYPIPRSALWVAASHSNPDLVYLLILAGFNASKEEWIHNREFPFSLESERQKELAEFLIESASSPRALHSQCRVVVRRVLGPGKQRRVNQLNLIPRKVKYYIALREL